MWLLVNVACDASRQIAIRYWCSQWGWRIVKAQNWRRRFARVVVVSWNIAVEGQTQCRCNPTIFVFLLIHIYGDHLVEYKKLYIQKQAKIEQLGLRCYYKGSLDRMLARHNICSHTQVNCQWQGVPLTSKIVQTSIIRAFIRATRVLGVAF